MTLKIDQSAADAMSGHCHGPVDRAGSHPLKSAMSGQKIPLVKRIQSGWAIFRAHRAGAFGNAESALAFHGELRDIAEAHLHKEIGETRILDLGCGQTATPPRFPSRTTPSTSYTRRGSSSTSPTCLAQSAR
jgi:hypothetical protein